MTESSYFWDTNGVGDGPGGGYSEADHAAIFQLFTQSTNKSGVSPDRDSNLAVTGSSSPVSVGTGRALVHGSPYMNTAPVSVTIPTPASLTRIDRIVLRKSWSAQTIRVTRIAGTEGGSFPAIVESDGTTWDLPLYRVSITTGGAITLTDERNFINLVADGGISTVKLAALAVTQAKLANLSVGTPQLIDAAVTQAKHALLSVGTPQLIDLGVTTAKVADGAVTNVKLGSMAQNRIRGRITASTGVPEDLTAAQARTILNVDDGADVTGAAIAAAATKTTPVAADTFPLLDSAAGNALKRVTLTNLAASVAGTNTRTLIIPLAISFIYQATTTANMDAASLWAYLDSSKIPASATVRLAVRVGNSNTISGGTNQILLRLDKVSGGGSNGAASVLSLNSKAAGMYLGSDARAAMAALGDGQMSLSLANNFGGANSCEITGVSLAIEW